MESLSELSQLIQGPSTVMCLLVCSLELVTRLQDRFVDREEEVAPGHGSWLAGAGRCRWPRCRWPRGFVILRAKDPKAPTNFLLIVGDSRIISSMTILQQMIVKIILLLNPLLTLQLKGFHHIGCRWFSVLPSFQGNR